MSTLEKNVLIRRIDTTTLHHLTAMLWVLYQTPIIAKKDLFIFVTQNVTVATGKPCKNTPYFTCSYLNNEFGDPHFLFLKCDQHARIKLCAKFKKICSAD